MGILYGATTADANKTKVKLAQKTGAFLLVGLLIMLALTTCGETTPTAAPSPALDHYERGNELSLNGQFDEAIQEYEKALELEPDDVDVLTNLGVALYNLGQLDQAIEHYSKAIEIAPNDADIRSNLAAAYVQKYQLSGAQDQLSQALAEYQRAVELNPELAEANFGLGVVYMLLDRNDDAIQAFERFQVLDSGQDPMATQNAEEYLRQLRGQ